MSSDAFSSSSTATKPAFARPVHESAEPSAPFTRSHKSTRLHMQSGKDKKRSSSSSSSSSSSLQELSAVAIGAQDSYASTEQEILDNEIFIEDWAMPVLSTSFLITANTVGASCLVLPELAAGPGFAATLGVSVVTYVINLVSGLMLAEVAIKQYESSGSEVASSFKDFADNSFNSPLVSSGIGCVSILTNAAILAFTFSKAGDMIGSEVLGGAVDPLVASFGFVGLVGVMLSTLDAKKLSNVAGVCVTGLFASFAGLLLPGLANVQDPMATLMAPGVAESCMGSAAQAFPIVLLSLVYQNIVPSVTKMLDYDRQKTTASLALGSFIPFAMYMAWLFASMGGGIDTSVGFAGPLLTGFTLATIAGSSIGTTMSVAEECDSFLKAMSSNDDDVVGQAPSSTDDTEKSDVFSLPAVAAALAVPMAGVMFGGDDMTVALGVAGSIGTPLLYGAVPALMAWNQRQESRYQKNLVPGGTLSLGALGLASTGFVGGELARVLGDAAAMVAI